MEPYTPNEQQYIRALALKAIQKLKANETLYNSDPNMAKFIGTLQAIAFKTERNVEYAKYKKIKR